MNDSQLVMLARGSSIVLDSLGMPTGKLKELDIIYAGPAHKWWLSARLLLGMSEQEARRVHEYSKQGWGASDGFWEAVL